MARYLINLSLAAAAISGCSHGGMHDKKDYNVGAIYEFCGKVKGGIIFLDRNIYLSESTKVDRLQLIDQANSESTKEICLIGAVVHLGCETGRAICTDWSSEYGLKQKIDNTP